MIVVNAEYITTLVEITKKQNEKISLEEPATVQYLIDKLITRYGQKMKEALFPNGSQELGAYVAILTPDRGYLAVEKIDAILKDGDSLLMGLLLFGG